MQAEVYIISGFLGAGKTTLIQKLIKETFIGRKIALIENDFGEASIDADLLRNDQFEVTEINNGCICCSLSGDFVKALSKLIKEYAPEVIIIEPSGVSKLSDIEKACREIKNIRIATKITVVDAKRCQSYYENFGAFFEDQIENADSILLSRVIEFPERKESAIQLVRKLNKQAKIISTPWQKLNIETVLLSEKEAQLFEICNHHEDQCQCHIHQNANDAFQTCTLTLDEVLTWNTLKECFQMIEKSSKMNLVRAKGVLATDKGFTNLQYVQGELQMTQSQYSGNRISFIGCGLDISTISEIFKSGYQ